MTNEFDEMELERGRHSTTVYFFSHDTDETIDIRCEDEGGDNSRALMSAKIDRLIAALTKIQARLEPKT